MTLSVSRREQEKEEEEEEQEEEEEKEEEGGGRKGGGRGGGRGGGVVLIFTGKLQHSADCCDCLVSFIHVKWYLLIIKVSQSLGHGVKREEKLISTV